MCVWAKGNTPSKRKIVLLVKYFSVHPVADSSSSFRITLFLVEVVHLRYRQVGGEILAVRVVTPRIVTLVDWE